MLLLDLRLSNRLVGDAAELNSASSIIDTGRGFGLPFPLLVVGVAVAVLVLEAVILDVCVELDAGPPPPPPSEEEVIDSERVRCPLSLEYDAMRVGVACGIDADEVDARELEVEESMYRPASPASVPGSNKQSQERIQKQPVFRRLARLLWKIAILVQCLVGSGKVGGGPRNEGVV